MDLSIVEPRVIEQYAMSLGFRSQKVGGFWFFLGGRGCVLAVFFTPVPEKGILNLIAHGSIIRVFTALSLVPSRPSLPKQNPIRKALFLIGVLCLRLRMA